MKKNKIHKNPIDTLLEEDLNSLKKQEFLFTKDIAKEAMERIHKIPKRKKNLKKVTWGILSAACFAGILFFAHVHKEKNENKLIVQMFSEIYMQEEYKSDSFEDLFLLDNSEFHY